MEIIEHIRQPQEIMGSIKKTQEMDERQSKEIHENKMKPNQIEGKS